MPSPAAIADRLRGHYALVAKDLLAPLIGVLAAGRSACGGDLDNMLIVVVVGLRTAEHRAIIDVDLADVLSGEVETYPSLQTNVRSISDSTGIPKETVRRKVGDLVRDGWIARDGNSLSFTPQGSRMFTDVREALLKMAAANYATVRSNAETPPGA